MKSCAASLRTALQQMSEFYTAGRIPGVLLSECDFSGTAEAFRVHDVTHASARRVCRSYAVGLGHELQKSNWNCTRANYSGWCGGVLTYINAEKVKTSQRADALRLRKEAASIRAEYDAAAAKLRAFGELAQKKRTEEHNEKAQLDEKEKNAESAAKKEKKDKHMKRHKLGITINVDQGLEPFGEPH